MTDVLVCVLVPQAVNRSTGTTMRSVAIVICSAQDELQIKNYNFQKELQSVTYRYSSTVQSIKNLIQNSMKVSVCKPILPGIMNWGNGLIEFEQKEFCSKLTQGRCNNVTVCRISDSEEEKFYVPLNRTLNKSKDLFSL